MLPSLLEISDPILPEQDSQVLLMIDNNPHALAYTLNFVKSLDHIKDDNQAASKFRLFLYSDTYGPAIVASLAGDKSTAKWLKEALRELLDSTEMYARSYCYWIDLLQHYRNKLVEGCDLSNYSVPSIDRLIRYMTGVKLELYLRKASEYGFYEDLIPYLPMLYKVGHIQQAVHLCIIDEGVKLINEMKT